MIRDNMDNICGSVSMTENTRCRFFAELPGAESDCLKQQPVLWSAHHGTHHITIAWQGMKIFFRHNLCTGNDPGKRFQRSNARHGL